MKGRQGYGRDRRDAAVNARAKALAGGDGSDASFADHLIAWMEAGERLELTRKVSRAKLKPLKRKRDYRPW